MRPARALARAIAVFLALAALAAVALRAAGGLPGVDYYELSVSLPEVANLKSHDDVRIAGVRVGQVSETRLRDGRVLVELQLSPGMDPLPTDTEAIIRAKGLLGARFVELRPGRAEETLADGATVRAAEEPVTEGIPDVLRTFDPQTRSRLATMFDEFGAGLLSRGGELNNAIRLLPSFERQLEGVSEAVLARRGAARRFFPSLAGAVSAADEAREDIARGFGPEARALRPFVDRRTELRATLDEAPPALAAARPALSEGRALLAAARELAEATVVTLPSPAAPEGFKEATALLREAGEPLRRTASLFEEARPTIPPALRLLHRTEPVLGPLERAFAELRPLVATLGEFGCDFSPLAERLRSMFGRAPRAAPGGEIGPPTDWRLTVARGGFTGPIPDESIRRDAYPPRCSSVLPSASPQRGQR